MKTLGQLSYETGQTATLKLMPYLDAVSWDDIGPELQECHEVAALAIKQSVLKEAIEALGEVKSCTLGEDLVGKITEAEAVSLLNIQRKIDIAAIKSLMEKDT